MVAACAAKFDTEFMGTKHMRAYAIATIADEQLVVLMCRGLVRHLATLKPRKARSPSTSPPRESFADFAGPVGRR